MTFESKCPNTLNFLFGPHKLRIDRPDFLSPNDMNQDVVVGKDSDNDNRYTDTSTINPPFLYLPDASTSVWTTHDNESKTHKKLKDQDSIPLATTRNNETTTHNTLEDRALISLVSDSRIRYTQSIYMTDNIKKVLGKSTANSLSHSLHTRTEEKVTAEINTITKCSIRVYECEETKTLEDMTRNDTLQDTHNRNMRTVSNDTNYVHTNDNLGNARNTNEALGCRVKVCVPREMIMFIDNLQV